MSKKRDVFPRTIVGFNTYFVLVLAYIIANATRLEITDEDVATLKLMMTNPDVGWKDLFALHEDSATKIKQVNEDIAKLLKEITKFLRYIYLNIPRKVMITQDYITFNIAPPAEKHPRKAKIESEPFVHMSSSRGGVIDFDIRENPNTHEKKLPDLADAIRVMGVILKPGDPLPADKTECNLTFISTKAVFSETFSTKESGNRFACYLQYVNLSDPSKDGPISFLMVCVIAL